MAATDNAWLEFAELCEALAVTRSKLAKRAEAPVIYMAFDLLLDGDDLLLHASLRLRRERLQAWTSAALQSVDAKSLQAISASPTYRLRHW